MSESQIFFSWTYLKTWITPRFTLFTDWKKNHPLPRYDVAKLGSTVFGAFVWKIIRKNDEKIVFFFN